MARRYEAAYQVKRNDNLGDPEFWNRRFEDIDLRMAARELDGERVATAVDQMTAVALQRLDDTFTPVINEAVTRLESVGALFTSSSETEHDIGAGAKTFLLAANTRASFVVSEFVAIRPVGHIDRGMICQVAAYDRDTGLLDVLPVAIIGSGTYDDWVIRVTGTPDLEHSSRTDNPHETTAAQVGAYTTAQVDALLTPKAPLASPALSGTPTAPTAATVTDTTQIATTAFVQAVVTALNLAASLAAKAPLASPALTGTPTAPTASGGTNTTQLATTAFVQAAIAALVASSPAALDTLNELAAALGNDANFSTTVTNALANKQPLDSDLTAIAALTTTSFGRSFLALADAAAARTLTGAVNKAGDTMTGTLNAPALVANAPFPGGFGALQASGIHAVGGYSTTAGGSCMLGRVDLTTTYLCLFQFGISTVVGSISTDSINTIYATTSDRRVKYDIRMLDFDGGVIDQLCVRKFKRCDDPVEGREHVGFIAQELHAVVPDAVVAGDNNPDARPGDVDFSLWQVDPAKLMPLAIAAIQDLRRRVAELEAKR